jgi:hypothetical protein
MEQFSTTKEVLAPDADLLNDKRYNASITSIARELAVPLEDVVARYKAMLATLAPRATVSDYIAILVEKKVKALYRTGYRNLAAPRYAS